MMRSFRIPPFAFVLLPIACCLLLSGCTTRNGMIVWSWTVEHEAMDRKIDSLYARINQLDSMEQAQHLATRAELGNEIAASSDRIDVLSARLDDFGARLNRLAERSVRVESAPASAGNSATLYRQAYTDYTRGRSDLAVPEFQSYIKSFPSSDLADNAQYWLGECYYDQGKWDTSLVQFRKVVDSFPESDKAPAALLKQGKCQEKLGDKPAAAAAYQLLIRKYALAPEAKLAEEALKQLKP